MKNVTLLGLLLLVCFAAHSQCSPQYIYGPLYQTVGLSYTMTTAATGGTWSTVDTGIVYIDPTTGVLTGKSPGYATVRYTLPGRCALFYSEKTVVILTSIRVPRSVCAGNAITLTDTSSTAGVWSSGDTTIARINPSTGVMRGVSNGGAMIGYRFTTSSGVICTDVRLVPVTSGLNGRRRIYLGDVSTFTDSVSGGIWTIADGSRATVNSATGVVMAISLGMTRISYTNVVAGVTCTSWDSLWIAEGISGNPRICIGDTTTYRDSVSGGSWTSSNPLVATVNTSSGLVNSLSAGTAFISYTVTSAAGTFVIFDTLTVASIPAPTHFSPINFCVGSADTLRSTTTPVRWYSSNPANFGIDPVIGRYSTSLSDTVPASAMLRYNSLYCSSVWDSTFVAVNPRPLSAGMVTGGGHTLCPGATDTFFVTGASETAGHWAISPYYARASISSVGVLTALASYAFEHVNAVHYADNRYGCSSNPAGSVYDTLLGSPGAFSIYGASTLNIGLIGNYTGGGTGYPTWSLSPTTIATVSTTTGQLTPLGLGAVTLWLHYHTLCGDDSVSRTVTIVPPATGRVSTHFIGFVNPYCSSPDFGVNVFPHSVAYTLKTYYGDGSYDTMSLPATGGVVISSYTHTYTQSRSYSVKQVLFAGSAPIDSILYSYLHLTCNTVSLTFFLDNDHDCAYSASADVINNNPMRVAVDSNGTSIDTIAVTSGLYYEEWGHPGDIYSFRIISAAGTISCPSSGTVYDTIFASSTAVKNKYIGFTCTGGGFDINEYATSMAGPHHHQINVHVGNSRCMPVGGTLEVTFDSRFVFNSANLTPSSITGSTARWNLTNISDVSAAHPDILISLEVPGGYSSWLALGTPLHSTVKIIPATGGDIDTNNNQTDRIDTVKGGYDPNYVKVNPAGNIIGGAMLHYTIQFENDGNDTAHNIYVMDTLPDYVDVNSLRIEMATHRMNTSILRYGAHNIIKFDFPNIMLPDSSHHNLCSGRVMFKVKTRRGLADGLAFNNHAGIYFDDNPVVLTDTAYNTILVPSAVVTSTCRDTICRGGPIHCDAAPRTVNVPHYQWYRNTTPAGTDSSGFTTASVAAGDSIKCIMRTIMDDTVYTTSNVLHIVERALPNPGAIFGATMVCPATTISLGDSVSGGTWSLANSHATISTGGIVTGMTAGQDTAIYTVTNICYPNSARFPFYVHPSAYAGVIVGATAMCDTSSMTMSDTASGGNWSMTMGHATISSTGRLTGVSGGWDTVHYTRTNFCGTAVATLPVRVDSIVHLTTPAGPSYVCQGDTITLVPNVTGGSWVASNGHATVFSTGQVRGIYIGAPDTITYTIINTCGTFRSTKIIAVNPVLVPSVSIGGIPRTAQCEGTVVNFTTTSVNGGSAPSYSWEKFGSVIGSGTFLSYAPAFGDIIVCKMNSNAICRTADVVADTAAVPIIAAVTPSISLVCSPSDTISSPGQRVTFFATTTYGGSAPTYQWYVNSTPVAGATSISYSEFMNYGDQVYCRMVSDIDCVTGSVAISNVIVIKGGTVNVAGVNSVGGVSLFPNPSRGEISIAGTLRGATDGVNYQVFDVTGKTVYSGAFTISNGKLDEHINFNNSLVTGRYMIRLVSGADVVVLNFVIE